MPFTQAIRLGIHQNPETIPLEDLRLRTAETRRIDPETIAEVHIQKVSLDARKGHQSWRLEVMAYEVGEDIPSPPPRDPETFPEPNPESPHVIIVGSGPAGLFCATELARQGIRFTVLERGKDVQERRKDIAALNRGIPADPESNYCFGEGGAGTYSDGKLYARSAEKEDVRSVLETLVSHGAPGRILWSWRPHIGSNRLPKVVKSMRESLRKVGKVKFNAKVTGLLIENETVCGVTLQNGEEIRADAVVLAAGHSATDALVAAKNAGAKISPKGFAVGVRAEHAQAWLDDRQYRGKREEAELPASFYELSARIDERGVYSFCMCPGGWIVPTQTEADSLVVNGMSLSKRDSPYANSGVVVELQPKDWCGKRGWRWGWGELLKKAAEISNHPLLHEEIVDPRGGDSIKVAEGRLPIHPDLDPMFGIRLQTALEVLASHAGGGDNRAPAQRVDEFVEGFGEKSEPLESSYLPGLKAIDFADILPKGVLRRLRQGLERFNQQIPGYVGATSQLIGVETRTSSPVRIDRDDESRQSPTLAGLYPCGEGAGYAGGIVSAAIDGLHSARAISVLMNAGSPS
jgi:hypothetical protein